MGDLTSNPKIGVGTIWFIILVHAGIGLMSVISAIGAIFRPDIWLPMIFVFGFGIGLPYLILKGKCFLSQFENRLRTKHDLGGQYEEPFISHYCRQCRINLPDAVLLSIFTLCSVIAILMHLVIPALHRYFG
jgi:hypothetical protein